MECAYCNQTILLYNYIRDYYGYIIVCNSCLEHIPDRTNYLYYYIEYYGTDVIHSFKSLLKSHNLSPDKTYAICKQN